MAKMFFDRIKAGESLTFDFIGDSVTMGTIHCPQEKTYVARFTHYIAASLDGYTVRRYDGIPLAGSAEPMKCFEGPIVCRKGTGSQTLDVVKNGIGGSTVKKATERPQDYTGLLPNGRRHDFVFLMFGINDALSYDKGKYVSAEQFKENYKRLTDILKADNPDVTIVITSATTPTVLSHERSPKYVSEEQKILVCSIEEHVERTKELARQEGFAYIDTHKLWAEHYQEDAEHHGHGDWLVGYDSCHPSPIASDVMGKFVAEQFLLLAKNGTV